MLSPRLLSALSLASLLLTVAAGHSEAKRKPSVRITELAPLEGDTSTVASAINERGQVAGISSDGETSRAVVWTRPNRPPTDLSTLPGLQSSIATAINNRGDVVGVYFTPIGEIRPFLVRDGEALDMGDMGSGFATATGINERGQVVGTLTLSSAATQAYVWEDGRTRDLGTLGGESSTGWAIRGRLISGGAESGDGTRAAVLWDARTGSVRNLEGDPGWYNGLALNKQGDVVGERIDEAAQAAMFWPKSGGFFELGTLGGQRAAAQGINGRRWIVGTSTLANGEERAFLATGRPGRTRMRDLNTLLRSGSGWVLQNASGINDQGEVIGNGTLNGASRGFVLRVPARAVK